MNRASSHPANQTSTGRTFLAGFGAAVILGFALVAPPCLLGRTVGWPLPTQLPTPAEVVAVLTQVPTTRFLIVVLGCVCWLAWAAFVLDVLAATIAAIRYLRDVFWDGTPTRAARPRRTIRPGAALVGLVVLALLVSSRSTPTTARPPTPTATVQLFIAAAHPDPDSSTGGGDGDGDGDGTVAVRPPAAGVHDSLWRIAQRELGNGNRWPELFTLNKNQPQPDGRTLIRPELIHPGWQIQLPTSTTDPHQGDSSPAGAQPAGPEVDSPALPEADGHAAPAPELAEPSTAPPMTTPPLQPPSSSTVVVDSEENWIELGPSVAIGSGLAATITAVVIAARRRSRRNARDARNGEPRLGPVIREISTHFTLTEATEPREPLDEDDQDDCRDLAWIDLEASPSQQFPSLELASEAESRPEHGSDSWTLLLDDAQRLGPLGVVGPGAPSALRALLIDAALRPPGYGPDASDQIVVTVTDGAAATLGVPASALTRTAPGAARVNPGPQVSNAEPADDEGSEGLQVRILLADDGDEADVVDDESTAVLVLGPTANGRTIYVRGDGTVVTCSPGVAPLEGRRLAVVDLVTALELLDLAQHASDNQPDDLASKPHHHPAPAPTTDIPVGSETPQEPRQVRTPWALLLLGRPTLLLRPAEGDSGGGEKEPGDVTALLTGRMLELLIFLALHPHGARRDAVVAALWPDTNRRRPANNLSAIITRLRSALRNHALGNRGAHCSDAGDDLPDIVTIEGETYRINPDTVTVDYWNFLAATADPPRHQNPSADASRPTTELTDESLDTLRTAHDLYRGPLADGIGTEWILAIREAARRTFLTTSAHLVRHYATIQPETALHLLETTTRRDDVNEKLYHDIIALQLRMGDNVGADNTLRLLMALLSDIEQSPSPATADFARLIHEELAKPPHPVS